MRSGRRLPLRDTAGLVEMSEQKDYGDAFRLGLRRAGLHWVRASYEVIAGVGAFLDEVASVRRDEADAEDDLPDEEEGPVRIDLD